MDKVTFVIENADAANSDAAAVAAALDGQFTPAGRRFELFEMNRGALVRPALEMALRQGYTPVIAVGGDGTVSAVADVLAGGDVPLGIVPTGVANLVARDLDIPLDIEKALRLVLDGGTTRTIDMMKGPQRNFVSHVSLGIYSRIVANTPRDTIDRWGRLAYTQALLKEIETFPVWDFELEIDGQSLQRRAALVMAANIAAAGFPFLDWGGQIRPDDGVVDVCVVRAESPREYAELVWRALQGKHRQAPEIEYFEARRAVRIRTGSHIAVRADGEMVGYSEIAFDVVPRAVPVIVPRSA